MSLYNKLILKQQADLIRYEVNDGKNTAERVGKTLVDLINSVDLSTEIFNQSRVKILTLEELNSSENYSVDEYPMRYVVIDNQETLNVVGYLDIIFSSESEKLSQVFLTDLTLSGNTFTTGDTKDNTPKYYYRIFSEGDWDKWIQMTPELSTPESAGLMSAADKKKLDKITDLSLIGTIELEDIDNLKISAVTRGSSFFRVMSAQAVVGLMGLFTESSMQEITEMLITHFPIDSEGRLQTGNQVGPEIFAYYRNYVVTDPKKEWSEWKPMIPAADKDHDGLMSAEDKKKLDGIQQNANKFELKAATATDLGGVMSKKTGNAQGRDYYVEVSQDGTMKVNVPWENTTYPVADERQGGLMSLEDKTKLDGITKNSLIGTIALEDLDKCGEDFLAYYGLGGEQRPSMRLLVTSNMAGGDGRAVVGTLDIIGDNMMHQITQIFTTHLNYYKDTGFSMGAHTDTIVYQYFRSWGGFGGGTLPANQWTEWQSLVPAKVYDLVEEIVITAVPNNHIERMTSMEIAGISGGVFDFNKCMNGTQRAYLHIISYSDSGKTQKEDEAFVRLEFYSMMNVHTASFSIESRDFTMSVPGSGISVDYDLNVSVKKKLYE